MKTSLSILQLAAALSATAVRSAHAQMEFLKVDFNVARAEATAEGFVGLFIENDGGYVKIIIRF
jgi:hypothetical protein